MTSTKMMTESDVSFAKQINGYDREQVDRYIESITQAYQTAYEEYTAVCAKHNKLLEEFKQLSEQPRQQDDWNKSNVGIIARTLVDTEAIANKIIADAQAEANRIVFDAQAEATKLQDAAYEERNAATIQANKTVKDANSEAAAAREEVSRLLDDAKAEAAEITSRAKRNLEEADESIAQLINKFREIASPKASDFHASQAP